MTHIHRFKCLNCGVNFSIESEVGDVRKAVADIPARCPKCLQVWGERGSRIEHQLDVPVMSDSLEARRKRNIQATREAQMQAAEYQKKIGREEMVQVKDPSGKKPPELVPKSVVDNLTQTIKEYNS